MSTNATSIYSPFTYKLITTTGSGGICSNSNNVFAATTSSSSHIIKYNLNMELVTNNWIPTIYSNKLFANDTYIFYGPTSSGTTGYCYNVTTGVQVATYFMGLSLSLYSIDADDTYVYFCYSNGKIYRFLITTTVTGTVGTPNTDNLWLPIGTGATLLTNYDNKYYVYTALSGLEIYTYVNQNITIYDSNWVPALPKVTYYSIDNDSKYIYLGAEKTIVRIEIKTGNMDVGWAYGFIVSSTSSYPLLLTVNNNYLYVRDGSSVILRNDLSIVCFKEDSLILTDQGYKSVQDLRKGDLVRTEVNGFVPVYMIAKREMYHPASEDRIRDQLYECSPEHYPELFEPLVITGCHSILVDNFVNEEQKQQSIKVNGDLHITAHKYRLPACVDERATVYDKPGTYTIYHFSLENDNYCFNYGVYANGLLVETCSKRFLKELANMEVIE